MMAGVAEPRTGHYPVVDVSDKYEPSELTISFFNQYDELRAKASNTESKKETTEELKLRILGAYRAAIESYPYPCVQRLRFAEPRIHEIPYYTEHLKGRLQDYKLVDFGCCMVHTTDSQSLALASQ